MRYRAIIFDMDDTLVKTWEIKWAHHKFVAKKYYGLELTDEKLSKHWGEPFSKLVASLYGTPESIEKMMERFVQHEPEYFKKAHHEAAEALAELQKEGIILGVVTAMISEVADEDMRREFPMTRFAFVQGADRTIVHKPDPLVFSPALERLAEHGVTDKKYMLYVGDALNDFYAARDAGMDFVGVATGFVDRDSFIKAGAEKVVSSLSELVPLVLKKGRA